MAVTSKLLASASGTASPSSAIYTVPAATTTILTNVILTNNTSSAIDTYFGIGTASNTEAIMRKTLSPNQTVTIDLKQVLIAGEQIWMPYASAINSAFYWFSGVEIT